MLTREENEFLTRIGPTTAMGDLLRQYWVPALLTTELPVSDGPPLRVRLLGEDLIAFRATSGEAGLVEQGCPHRRASLFFGRNEENGLRCGYHGWKFNVQGQCVDMPNEPVECDFKEKVRLKAYPCRERNGVIWAYLGPRLEPPPLPEFEWNLTPDNVPFLWRNYRACNWVQALEGDIDSSHINYLHGTRDSEDLSTVPGRVLPGARTGNCGSCTRMDHLRLKLRRPSLGSFTVPRGASTHRTTTGVSTRSYSRSTRWSAETLMRMKLVSTVKHGCPWMMSRPWFSSGNTARENRGQRRNKPSCCASAIRGVSCRQPLNPPAPGNRRPMPATTIFSTEAWSARSFSAASFPTRFRTRLYKRAWARSAIGRASIWDRRTP